MTIPLVDMYKRVKKQDSPTTEDLELMKIQELTYKVFGLNPDGRELFKKWTEKFMDQPRFDPTMHHNLGYYRSGYEAMILEIKQFLDYQKQLIASNSKKEETL